jgi:hypothetical protein
MLRRSLLHARFQTLSMGKPGDRRSNRVPMQEWVKITFIPHGMLEVRWQLRLVLRTATRHLTENELQPVTLIFRSCGFHAWRERIEPLTASRQTGFVLTI